jgi:hypothetical protein
MKLDFKQFTLQRKNDSMNELNLYEKNFKIKTFLINKNKHLI